MDAILERCIALITETKHIPPSEISAGSTFESLRIDSLDKINLSFTIEEEYEIAIPDQALDSIHTVGDMASGVHRLLKEKAASASNVTSS